MHTRSISRLRVLPIVAVVFAACNGIDIARPITLSDLAGQYEVTNITVYWNTDRPFRQTGGGLEGVRVTIEPTGDFTVAATAATGLSSETGTITISGDIFSVATSETGSIFLRAGLERFAYRHGILQVVEGDVPRYLGEDLVTTMVTTELTKR